MYLERRRWKLTAVWVEKTMSSNCGFFFCLCDEGYDPKIFKQWFLIQFFKVKASTYMLLQGCFKVAVDSSFKWWFCIPCMWEIFLFLYNMECSGTKEELVEVKYDLLVGADGANSAVRSQILHYEERNPYSSK
jgi:hypothetical protein